MPLHPQPYPILEFDDAREAVIEPSRLIPRADIPARCVLCFFQEVLAALPAAHGATQVAEVRSEQGITPVYALEVGGTPLVAAHPGVGAPFAAAVLEELIAMGCDRFIVCGGAGVLRRDLVVGHPVIVTAAVRDEGTSYHYMPPSREVPAEPGPVAALEGVLRAHGVEYLAGKTWTTDAFYRETPDRVARRREEGCLTVEMEAAAFLAVARFRGVALGQLLYSGDDLSGAVWDSREWHGRTSVRERLFWLAAEACAGL
jgi:uridine phosphorylase